MKARSRGLLLSALVLLSACAQYRPAWLGGPSRSDPYYARTDLDEILRFGAELAGKPGPVRAEACRSLLKRQRDTPHNPGIKLHLMTGRLLSDACGDARKLADAANELPANSFDQQMRWWVAIQGEALKRLGSGQKRAAGSERKSKAGKDAPESKPEPAKPAATQAGGGDEAEVLRKKLEEIRSIERKLDETNGSP